MATPPYKGWVQAYAGSGNSETPGVESGAEDYTLATPTGFGVTDVSYAFRYDWTYTPGSDDDLAGFKLWFSNNPTPNWGTAMDVGVAFPGDSANEYQFELPKNLGGFIFCYVQAYGHHGGTTLSSIVILDLPAILPATVPLIGLNPATSSGKSAVGLVASPVGSPNQIAFHDGTPIPFGCSILTATATLDFPSMAANTQQQLSIGVLGAKPGDVAYAGPNETGSVMEAGFTWCASVTAANTVTIRLTKDTTGTVDPASRVWRAVVISF